MSRAVHGADYLGDNLVAACSVHGDDLVHVDASSPVYDDLAIGLPEYRMQQCGSGVSVCGHLADSCSIVDAEEVDCEECAAGLTAALLKVAG